MKHHAQSVKMALTEDLTQKQHTFGECTLCASCCAWFSEDFYHQNFSMMQIENAHIFFVCQGDCELTILSITELNYDTDNNSKLPATQSRYLLSWRQRYTNRSLTCSTKESGSSDKFIHFYTKFSIEWRYSFHQCCKNEKIL